MTLNAFIALLTGVRRTDSGYTALCPAHDDRKPSLSVSQGVDGKILVHCFSGCSLDSILKKIGLKARDLFTDCDLATLSSIGKGPHAAANTTREIEAVYQYTDADGRLLYENVRYRPKDFRWRRPDGSGGYIYNLDGVDRVPYRLPDLVQAMQQPEPEIWFTEGEKDADNLRSLGRAATSFKSWRHCLNRYINGAHAVLFRDHDTSGVKLSIDAARIIAEVAASVKIIDLFDGEPRTKHGKDISDWIKARRSAVLDEAALSERLSLIVGGSQTWEDEHGTTQAENEPVHEGHTAVRRLVPKVDGADLLDKIEGFIGRFVAYPSVAARVAHTLWIAHTWLMDHWDSTPRIAFLSAEPASGKSRALEVTEPLVPRAIHAVNTTPAYLFRKVSDESGPPTLLYDEADTVFGPRAKNNEDIRGMLNAGHRRGATAGRCIVRGKTIETEELPAYCAVALAALHDLPETIMTRSVVVRMRRRLPREKIGPWRMRKSRAEAAPIFADLEIWAASIERIPEWPEMPSGVQDRNADVWEALLAVADIAGGAWPSRGREAAVALVASAKENVRSLGVQLLSDLRTVFADSNQLATETIIQELVALPESPWANLGGQPLDGRVLALHLRKYDITSRQLKINKKNSRGYKRSELQDAWSRYLPTPCAENGATSATCATNSQKQPEKI